MLNLSILVERHDGSDVDRLNDAWSRPETFAFIPDKTPVDGDWIRRGLESLPPELREGHFALLTSGSTGRPKLVVGERARAETLARLLHVVQESESVRETLLVLPLSYCYSFVNQWLWARCMGRALRPTAGFADVASLAAVLESAGDAMICLTGVHVPLLDRYFADRAFGGVTRVHFAGGAFPQARLDVVRRVFPNAAVFNNYGCAEAMPRLTVCRAELSAEPGDVGQPLEGIEVRTGDDGDVQFRSAYGARAFVDDDGVHAIAADEWVSTGDLGTVTPAGTLCLTGRRSEVFKRHGEKVTLPLVAETIRSVWPGTVGFYRERDATGEDAYVVVLAPAPGDDELQAILQQFRRKHGRAAWPLRIESAPDLPKLPNGKIDAVALPSVSGKHLHWRQRI